MTQIDPKEYEVFFQLSVDLFCIVGFDGKFKLLNPAWSAALGYPLEEMTGKPYIDFVHPEDREATAAEARRVKQTGGLEGFSFENRYRCKDGTYRWLGWRSGTDREKQLYYAVAREISERKAFERELEEKLRERSASLADQQRFLRQVIDLNPNLIFAKDRNGRFTLVNQTVAEVYGTTPSDIEGKTDADFNPNHEEVEAFRRDDLEVMDSLREKFIAEETITDAGGKKRFLQTSKRPIVGKDGVATHVLGVATDITQRKLLEEQLRQSQKMEAVGLLAGGVAHDFNNILTVILGLCDIRLRRPEGSPLKDLAEIKGAAQKAATLTRQLLAFSRKQVLQPRVLDLSTVVADMQNMLRRLIGEDIEFETSVSPQLGRVRVDPGQVEQIIMNLAVNARDAMPDGGKLTISLGDVDIDQEFVGSHPDAKPGPHVLLAVSDTGMGMDAETASRVFEPFFTTKEKGKGTGLGLSTVYGIVKQSGGNIYVRSLPNQGTAFEIYFPAAEEQDASRPKTEHPGAAAPCQGTLLVVEDEDGVRNLVLRVLRGSGYQLLEARTPEEAVALCERHKGEIQLLLTDVVLPRVDGRALAKRLSALHPEMKVLYMSGYTDNVIVHHGILDPGVEFMEKPILPDRLLEKVRQVLAG